MINIGLIGKQQLEENCRYFIFMIVIAETFEVYISKLEGNGDICTANTEPCGLNSNFISHFL